jgi:hypothetical protein
MQSGQGTATIMDLFVVSIVINPGRLLKSHFLFMASPKKNRRKRKIQMQSGQGTATIMDHFVVSIVMNPVVRRSLEVTDNMEYWEVKKKVLDAYGQSLIAEIHRLATMDWQTLAKEFMPTITSMMQQTTERKRKWNKLARLMNFKTSKLEDMTVDQQRLLREIIQELQSSWKQCLPQAAKLTEI